MDTLIKTSMRTGASDKEVMELTEGKMRTLNRALVTEFKSNLQAYEGHMKRLASSATGKVPLLLRLLLRHTAGMGPKVRL